MLSSRDFTFVSSASAECLVPVHALSTTFSLGDAPGTCACTGTGTRHKARRWHLAGNTSALGDSHMGPDDFPESDWKVFRELRALALERFCKRVLEELEPLRQDTSRSHHQRYLDVFRVLRARDEELAHAFNDPRRSRMIVQLAAIAAYGLLVPHELERFTARTRATVESLAKESG